MGACCDNTIAGIKASGGKTKLKPRCSAPYRLQERAHRRNACDALIPDGGRTRANSAAANKPAASRKQPIGIASTLRPALPAVYAPRMRMSNRAALKSVQRGLLRVYRNMRALW